MPKIIVAEDDSMIAGICQKKFEAEGFEVVIAPTGREVLTLLKRDRFDLVLLDLILPEMNGLDVLKEIKKSGHYDANTKVVIFSNLTDVEQQQKATANGADGFIFKGNYKPSELVIEVKRYLNQFSEQKKNEVLRNNNGDQEIQNNGSKKKILFIEDETVFLEMFGNKLLVDGYDVEFARNGAWGLKEAQGKNFDLIIMDMVMPAMEGKEMIEKLKADEKTKNIPIIVLSASAKDEDIEYAKKMGVVSYFGKTQIVPSDLSRRVQEILK